MPGAAFWKQVNNALRGYFGKEIKKKFLRVSGNDVVINGDHVATQYAVYFSDAYWDYFQEAHKNRLKANGGEGTVADAVSTWCCYTHEGDDPGFWEEKEDYEHMFLFTLWCKNY